MTLNGDPEMIETATFTSTFNNFFDALNVSNFKTGKTQKNPFKNPYYSPDDFRLKVHMSDILFYVDMHCDI